MIGLIVTTRIYGLRSVGSPLPSNGQSYNFVVSYHLTQPQLTIHPLRPEIFNVVLEGSLSIPLGLMGFLFGDGHSLLDRITFLAFGPDSLTMI